MEQLFTPCLILIEILLWWHLWLGQVWVYRKNEWNGHNKISILIEMSSLHRWWWWWPVQCPPAEADYNRDWQKAIFRASGVGCGWMVVGRVYLGCISASWEPPLLGCRRRSELPTRVILSSCQCQCRLSPHSSQIFPPSPQQF